MQLPTFKFIKLHPLFASKQFMKLLHGLMVFAGLSDRGASRTDFKMTQNFMTEQVKCEANKSNTSPSVSHLH